MGSVQRQDRKKRWLARYRDTEGKQHSKSFELKGDALQWVREQERRVDRGTWTDPTARTVTFRGYAEIWLASLDPELKPTTRASYEANLRRLLPYFGDQRLSRITTQGVRAWQGWMQSGTSPATVRQARQVLGAILGQATADGLIPRNPVQGVKAPRAKPRRQMYLTAFELKALADAADGIQPGAGALVWFLGWSGLRWGEATALRVRDVDQSRRRVRVEQAYSEVGGTLHLGAPKTHETRTVIVPGFVVDRIAPLCDGKAPDALVVTAPRGGPLRNANFRAKVWKPAVTAAELDPSLVIHDLRDTAASLMIATGASIKAVQRALGHKSAAMTLDVYGGLFEEDLEALADRMEERWGEVADGR
jgi:integrase